MQYGILHKMHTARTALFVHNDGAPGQKRGRFRALNYLMDSIHSSDIYKSFLDLYNPTNRMISAISSAPIQKINSASFFDPSQTL